jgi:hypothetical protein
VVVGADEQRRSPPPCPPLGATLLHQIPTVNASATTERGR